MLRIRLSMGGVRKRPVYKIVVADGRYPRDGKFIEKIGSYNPLLPKDKKNYAKVKGVAGRIAQAILESGKSQAEIAKKLGMFPTAISRWKTGTTEPTPANINSLSKILGCDVNWLMSGNTKSGNTAIESQGEENEEMYRLKYEQKCEEVLAKDNIIIELQRELIEVHAKKATQSKRNVS